MPDAGVVLSEIDVIVDAVPVEISEELIDETELLSEDAVNEGAMEEDSVTVDSLSVTVVLEAVVELSVAPLGFDAALVKHSGDCVVAGSV